MAGRKRDDCLAFRHVVDSLGIWVLAVTVTHEATLTRALEEMGGQVRGLLGKQIGKATGSVFFCALGRPSWSGNKKG